MRKLIVTLSIISIVTVGLCLYLLQKPVSSNSQAPTKLVYTPQAMLTILNRVRAENGSKPLILDERLNQSAQAKAAEMYRDKIPITYYNPHIGLDGKHGYEYALEIVPECKTASENIQLNLPDSAEAFNEWYNSPSHKEVMLSDRWEVTGFGVKESYIVNHFCDLN